MRFESESRVWSTAAGIVRERVRSLPEFATARAEVVRTAITICRGRDVPAMREVGGFSGVLLATIDKLPDAYRVNVGSKLLPWSVASELAVEVARMREEVQSTLSKEGQGTCESKS